MLAAGLGDENKSGKVGQMLVTYINSPFDVLVRRHCGGARQDGHEPSMDGTRDCASKRATMTTDLATFGPKVHWFDVRVAKLTAVTPPHARSISAKM